MSQAIYVGNRRRKKGTLQSDPDLLPHLPALFIHTKHNRTCLHQFIFNSYPIMHETVTSSSPTATTFFSHNPDDYISSSQAKSNLQLAPASRRMLSASMASRRTPIAGLSKPDVISPVNGGGRWRLNATGQFVDSSAGEWDLADEIVKLQISPNGADGGPPIRTPPQSKAVAAAMVQLQEASPLETASETSIDSTDTSGSQGSALSSASHTLRAPQMTPLKIGVVGEARNRPHSYSGGLSSTDLVRLQQAGSPVDYQIQQRQFNPLPQGAPVTPAGAIPPYVPSRPANVTTNMPYRQLPRGFNPQLQPVLQSPTSFAYPASVHAAPMSVNNQQQMYEMLLPTPPLENPAMTRLQQQHGIFPRTHQHSASDPASLRDPATLALLSGNLQAFAASQMYAPAMAPPAALSMFANQFYGAPQEQYPSPELAAQMMAQLQAQYTGTYGVPVPGQNVGLGALSVNGSIGNGPSANNRKLGLYKTELCRSWEEKGSCRYGAKCQFAHGEDELRKVTRHPKYKTEICRTFWVSGSCPYGKRCCFIHTELPASGAPPGADGAPPPTNTDGRARSSSTNSDPNDVATSSLLARISAKRTQEGVINSGTGSVSTTPPSAGFQINGRPGSLRVDTSVLDASVSSKQNKSAYPTFAHNGVLMPAGEETAARSPGPVTAGPDFGRHASSRIDIVGSQQRISKNSSANPNLRHSFNGSEIQLDFSTPTATNPSSQIGLSPQEASKSSARINGHVRSGSAGNWASATRSSHLTAYPLSSIPGGEITANSPWSEYNMSGGRLSEQNWV
ncbi:Zinc finger protein zfs1 [Grifola frondosa]|uniref:Zinc finger protein zfs1 n=1 Tax=Grifola frondosa TaxID=5627 RepID=A0A1C7MQ69_GRIFR|nr:Zinc finger protein zfs1 [Grifola frondosa]